MQFIEIRRRLRLVKIGANDDNDKLPGFMKAPENTVIAHVKRVAWVGGVPIFSCVSFLGSELGRYLKGYPGTPYLI